jgi:transcriptional regulator of arginine metabolism
MALHIYAESRESLVIKSQRLHLLAQLVGEQRYSSQEELAHALARARVPVTQATLSRDLRTLGVGKRPGPGGKPIYQLPGPAAETLDRDRQLLDLRAFVNEVKVAQNLVVVSTPPGHANGVARAIDLLGFEGLVGSVAGDDTVLIILSTHATATRFKRHVENLRNGGAS